MKETIAASDRETLKGKRILFVEDRPQTLEFFLEELDEVAGEDLQVEKVNTLGAALRSLRATTGGYDLVVIDLHMPGELPAELRPFAERIGIDLNEGQTLGLWIHEHLRDIPYLYLSSVPDAYVADAGDAPALEPINKFEEKLSEFAGHLAMALRKAAGQVVAARAG